MTRLDEIRKRQIDRERIARMRNLSGFEAHAMYDIDALLDLVDAQQAKLDACSLLVTEWRRDAEVNDLGFALVKCAQELDEALSED